MWNWAWVFCDLRPLILPDFALIRRTLLPFLCVEGTDNSIGIIFLWIGKVCCTSEIQGQVIYNSSQNIYLPICMTSRKHSGTLRKCFAEKGFITVINCSDYSFISVTKLMHMNQISQNCRIVTFWSKPSVSNESHHVSSLYFKHNWDACSMGQHRMLYFISSPYTPLYACFSFPRKPNMSIQYKVQVEW